MLRGKSRVDDGVEVLKSDVGEGGNLLVVVPRSLAPDFDSTLGRSFRTDTGLDARLERLDNASTETRRLLGDLESGSVGRGGREEGSGGGRSEWVSEEEGGREGKEEEEAGGGELKGRRKEVGVRSMEEALECCRGEKGDNQDGAISKKEVRRRKGQKNALASPRSAMSRSSSSNATLLAAILSLGSNIFCLFAFLPCSAPAFPSPCVTTTGSKATLPTSSKTVLHTLARDFFPSSGSTTAPRDERTTEKVVESAGRIGERGG